MKKYVNGQYEEMTSEEIADWKALQETVTETEEPTVSDLLAAIERGLTT